MRWDADVDIDMDILELWITCNEEDQRLLLGMDRIEKDEEKRRSYGKEGIIE